MNFIKENWQKFKKMIHCSWVNQNKFVFIISVFAVIILVFIISLFFCFESTMDYVGIKPLAGNQWTTIKNLGYAFGVLLLIIQILISNRRADASEKIAVTTLNVGIEQRYHNATTHLGDKNPAIRIGAIYNLYHISQSTDTYDATIFDMFCEYLKHSENNIAKSENNITKKEREIIVSKLFTVETDKRVLKNPENINLVGANLQDMDLSGANLAGANLSGAKLDSCVFDKANLSKAKLPADLTNIKSMNEATIDGVDFSSNSNLQGLSLQKASWKNAQVRYTNLSNANLSDANLENTDFTGTNFTGTNLTKVKGLTVKQLSVVKCLFEVKGLSKELERKLREEKPELFKALNIG